jgi:hypothetical protein
MRRHFPIFVLLVVATVFAFMVNGAVHAGARADLPFRTAPDRKVSYDSARNYCNNLKRSLKTAYDRKLVTDDSISRIFTQLLVSEIIPYWYGTAWDFNGYTAKPGEGTVACGYFVSTTLQHSGIKLNRYKMAQKASMDEAIMLEPRDSLYIRHGDRDDFLIAFRKKCRDGLYMVGLSFHVGYLYKTADEVYFLHSSYLDPVAVVHEKASESVALGQSTVFVVADITHNKKLMMKWLNNEELKH